VPVALSSSDSVNWTHSTNDLSACRPEMCVACIADTGISEKSSCKTHTPPAQVGMLIRIVKR
jgi:hypothetical protein